MNNKMYYENILTLTKSLIMIYINGAIESSNEKTRNLFIDGLSELLAIQSDLYESMADDGYYKVVNVESKEVKKLLNKLKKNEG